MRKLSLKMDDLRVESFPTTAPAASLRGTVAAHEPTKGRTCTCPTVDDPSCLPTCGIIPDTTIEGALLAPNTFDCPLCA